MKIYSRFKFHSGFIIDQIQASPPDKAPLHTLNGKSYPAEILVVLFNSKYENIEKAEKIAVLVFLVEVSFY